MLKHPIYKYSAAGADGSKPVQPVIIYAKRSIKDIKSCIIENYGQIKYELPFINALAVDLREDVIPQVAENSRIRLITEDAVVSKSCDCTVQLDPAHVSSVSENRVVYKTGVEHARSIGVAVIDTGVTLHEDLLHPYNRVIAFHDFIGNRTTPYDDDGHGTHVTGIIAGCGFVDLERCGIAPYANIIAIKALDNEGNGNASDILAGMQWSLDHRKHYNIRVINLSLGITPDSFYMDDPLVKGVEAAVRAGLTVVAAAGNNGPTECTISSPGISPYAITVGAALVSKSDGTISVAPFSSRGPTGAGLTKPDFLAPGVDIFSLDSKNPRGYVAQSGTSMATPFVSGAAANLYGQWPDLTPPQIKKLLLRSCCRIKAESSFAQGYGVLL